MKSTSLSIQFTVNDLGSNYEVIGTSDNYSFQYKLGRGSDIVDSIGDTASKIVPLHGNYGVFEVKVFAISDIGIRSDFIVEEVEISPPSFEETFTFNDLKILDIKGGVKESLTTEYSPSSPGDKLIVSQQFAGKNIELSWSLIPPQGHALEGQSVGTELLSDTLFSGIIVDIKTGNQVVDLSAVDESNDAIQSLSRYLNTAASNVSIDLKNYRNFSLVLDEDVFNGLNLPRDVTIDLVAVDKFGRTCTGTISGSNPVPSINNLTSSLNGTEMSFSWAVDTIDYSGMNVNVLGLPEDRELFDSGDLLASKNFIDDLNYTASNNLTWDNAFNYSSGDLIFENGNVYRSNIDHTSAYANRPSSNSVEWTNYGSSVDNIYNQQNISRLSFSQEQFFGYKYYYTFQVFDDFGSSDIFLLSEDGSLVSESAPGASLYPYQAKINIANLRYFEREDDLVFNWDIVDQDNNAVDLVQYRAALKEGGLPSILGLSGSLYDVHSNQKITGLTEGNNSISLTKNQDGDTEVVYGLQTSKIFDTYEYTREINNQIYGTGGFPKIYEVFDYTKNYNSGDFVTNGSDKIYKAVLDTDSENPTIKPFYDSWQKQNDYIAGASFKYDGKIYKVNQDFGPRYTQGLFDFSTNYVAGDLVISPNENYTSFNSSGEYSVDDIVVYNNTLYKCLVFQEAGSAIVPGTDSSQWRVASLFSEIDCDVYEAIESSQSIVPANSEKWRISNPSNSNKVSIYIENHSGFVSDWSASQDFTSGDLVVYQNDIWSGVQDSGPNQNNGAVIPGASDQFWVNQSDGQDIIFQYNSGDIVYNNGFVYKADADNPVGGPILATDQAGEDSYSTYDETQWVPYWQEELKYQDIIFGHVGIPQSGKRSVGIELAIVDREGDIFDKKKLYADNPPPYILRNGFSVDSISEATKIKFNFNYALGFQEKTTKVYLYRSEDPVFDVIDEYGFPLTGEDTSFVKSVVGAGDATFGQNITQIIDEPPIPSINGVDQITGYYYKLLPFDDFGSGVLYEATNNAGILEQVLVYPKRYNSPNPDAMPGRVLRTDPTAAAGAVPGPVLDLSGVTAFENFFLNWRAPHSEYEIGSTTLFKQKQNDIDHYEVWASDDSVLYTGDNQGNANPWAQAENTGYRKIEGVIYSVGSIPTEVIDPALNISGAENIFNVPANSPSIETVYPGKTNETKNFWIRAVDFAGNKSPFTGANVTAGQDILGLPLTLGQATATDIADFEINMTEKFGNSIALVPNNPFKNDDPPNSDSISWIDHVLYYQGTGYFIDAGNTNSGYVWWDVSEQPNPGDYEYGALNNIHYSGGYNLSDAHPQGGYDSNNQYIESLPGFEDTDFIIARNSNGVASPVYYAFPNALIGTANIAEAAIISAKINDLAADKITAGEIRSADIQISTTGSKAGVVRSAGFTGVTNNPSDKGFFLSGDGTFGFQNGGSSLSFEDDTLTLRGKLRQSSGFDYDFIDLDVTPSYFYYVQASGYEDGQDGIETFIPDDNSPTGLDVIATFRNSSVPSTGVRFRMDVLSGSNRRTVFGYNDFTDGQNLADGEYNISGFIYDPNAAGAFRDDSVGAETKVASGVFALGSRDDGSPSNGFDRIIDEAFPGSGLADSVILYTSGINSTYEKSVTITRINDGRVGQDGIIGENARTVSLSTNTQAITYDEFGSNPSPSQNSPFNITGTALNTDGTVYYEFIVDEVTEQNETGNTYLYTPPASFSSLPDVVRVNIREGSDSSTILASDTLTIFGVKPGEDGENAYTVVLTNENHTFSTDKNGNVSSYAGSGTKVIVYNGATELEAVASSPSSDQFSISRSVTSGTITAGAVDSNSPDTILQHSNMTTDQAVVTITITINIGGTSIVFTRDQTLSKSKQGINGNYGLSPTYRGEWDTNIDYVFEESTASEPGRGDIVKYTNSDLSSQYFISIATPNQGNYPVENGSLNSSYWEEFGAVFDNVATNILLTEEAYVTDELVIGDYGFSGAIVSNGFTGGLLNVNTNPYLQLNPTTENYNTPGFLLARTDDNVVFDVGGTGLAGQTGYLRFSSEVGKIEIRGSFTNNTTAEDIVSNLNFNESLNTFSNPSPNDTLATFIGGGYNNEISAPAAPSYKALSSSIVAGANNSITGRFSFIGNGVSNVCNDNFSFLGGGYKNEMPVNDSTTNAGCNFIGCGQNNTINGGSNQTILGGDHNSITYTL